VGRLVGACINTDVRAADHRRGGRGSFARVQTFLASVERPHLEQRVPQGAGRFYSSMLGTAQHLRYKNAMFQAQNQTDQPVI
jgi:hypothetical protein